MYLKQRREQATKTSNKSSKTHKLLIADKKIGIAEPTSAEVGAKTVKNMHYLNNKAVSSGVEWKHRNINRQYLSQKLKSSIITGKKIERQYKVE